MKLFIALVFCLFSIELFAATHHVPADPDNHGPNIPEVGSSLFDKLYSRTDSNGQAVYDIPYPLPKLVERLKAQNGDLVHTLLPFSRSLQRPQDLSYDPLLNPRIVLTPTYDRDAIVRGRIFFGFVKAKDQLEIISFNDEAGRFEFQVVTNYSTKPKAFYVDRGKCLSCHQGQAPIFASPVWQDTSVGVMGSLILKKLGINSNKSDESFKLATEYLFGSLPSRDSAPAFDLIVREGAKMALDERVWVYGCGSDRACRLGLLLKTLAPNAKQSAYYINHAKEVLAKSPLRDQVEYNSFLSSTTLGAEHIVGKYGSQENVVNNPQALSDIISSLYRLKPKDNPATRRPLPLSHRDFMAPLAGFAIFDRTVLRDEIPDINRVAEILIQRYQAGDALFDAKPMNKLEIMGTLLSDAGSPLASNYSNWLAKPTPEKALFEGDLIPVFQRAELNLFSQHCSRCHGTDLAFPPQFLTGSEDEVLSTMQWMKPQLLYKLENNLMPPNEESRQALKDSGGLDIMLEFINEL